jgi:DNA-binding NarL/FixJ family response regulator
MSAEMTGLNNEIKIAFLTRDLVFVRELLAALKRTEDTLALKERFKIFPVSDSLRFVELCTKHSFDLLLVEEEFVTGDPVEWLKKTEKAIALHSFGKRPPTLLVSATEKNPDQIRLALTAGFSEVMIRPMDVPVLLQAMHRLLPTKTLIKEQQLFKMSASDTVNVAQPMTFESISETEMIAIGSRQFASGEILSLYAPPFDDTQKREVIALCGISVATDSSDKLFRTTFYLQGITPSLSKSIRKWIQSTSAKAKAA